jgi:polynucleotide 5'-kinase involved in rRNA processing
MKQSLLNKFRKQRRIRNLREEENTVRNRKYKSNISCPNIEEVTVNDLLVNNSIK